MWIPPPETSNFTLVITFTDLNFDIDDLAAVFVFHDGDLYPGPDRVHRLWPAALWDSPPYEDAFVYAAPRVVPVRNPLGVPTPGEIIVMPALEIAQLIARRLVALPNVVQDLCFACHPDRRRPNRPRWWIYHNGPFEVITPCIVVDQLYPP
jgi:hypothetical protein